VKKKNKFFSSLKSLKNGVGSGVYPELDPYLEPFPDPLVRDTDPDSHQNVTDNEQRKGEETLIKNGKKKNSIPDPDEIRFDWVQGSGS
jgi:hypothetical protein